ncbi:MAG: hypothetical protein L3J95_05900 [Thermoplasmata archaeon]|nr:hypothetical protein [Thermoplasmata archaeon]MCI4359930.1 hypothetical protein [Thermoplasmata archaeon]
MAIVILLAGLGGVSLIGLGNAPSSGWVSSSPVAHLERTPTAPVERAFATSTSTHPFPAVPKVTLTPANGFVGDAVVINGTGFLASVNATVNTVTVSWAPGGWVLCNVETNATGGFVCGFVVPDGVTGAHAIKAVDTVPNTASATFTVKPEIILTPTSGLAGTSASVTATGFAGNSNTTFVWAPTASQLCKLNTSYQGGLTCQYIVPVAGVVGVHLITATDSAANSASGNFTVAPAPPTVSVVLTSALHLYSATPLTLNWTITASVPINVDTTRMWVLVQDLGSAACPYVIFNGLGQGVAVQNPPCTVANLSLSWLLVDGTNSYTFTLTNLNLTSQNYHGGTLPFATEYSIGVFVSISSSPYVNGITAGSVGIGGATQNNYLQTYLPSGLLVSPNPGGGISTGNTSVIVSYSGDFVSGAVVNIYNSGTGLLVYSAGVAVAGPGPHVGTAGAQWRPTQPGKYTATLNLSGAFGYTLTSFPLTVVPAGTTVYVNSTTYHNASLLKGLNQGTTAALLLLIGLIIGLVVALLLGRMVWGGSTSKPPTPWSSKPADSGPGGASSLKPNECPVCHQQFASAMELSDHQKKAHGTNP